MGQISYDKDLTLRAAAKRMLPKDIWARFVITNVENKVSEGTGHMMLVLKCAPLKDPDDIESKTGPSVRYNVVLPFKNPELESHEPPNTASMMPQVLRAIYGTEGDDGIPEFPVRGKDKKLTYRGEEIDDSEEQEKREEVITKTFDKLIALHDAPDQLLNETFYAKVGIRGDFNTFATMAYTLPANAECHDFEEAAKAEKTKAKETAAPAKGKSKGK
jgi:hypothetical protein